MADRDVQVAGTSCGQSRVGGHLSACQWHWQGWSFKLGSQPRSSSSAVMCTINLNQSPTNLKKTNLKARSQLFRLGYKIGLKLFAAIMMVLLEEI